MSRRWEPISYLPGASTYVDEHVDALQDRLTMFEVAVGKPHAMDDATLHNSLDQHRQLLRDAHVPEEQLAQWLREPLTAAQRAEVERLVGQMARWRERCGKILERIEALLRQNAAHGKDPMAGAAFYIELQCRPYASLSPLGRRALPFVLPPEVTVSREDAGEMIVYVFEHRDLGFLGQLEVTRAAGGVDVRLGVSEAPDGASRQRKALLTSLTDRLLAGMHAERMEP